MIDWIDPTVNGFMLGLTTGPMCFTMCMPMLISVTLGGEKLQNNRIWIFIGKFAAGRFVAYLGFGILVSLLGKYLGSVSHQISATATVVLSIILIGYGLGLKLPHVGLCKIANRSSEHPHFPTLLGFLTGLNICPPFLLAISYTLQRTVSPMFGILFFMSFFVATSLYLLPLGIIGYFPRRDRLLLFGKIAAVGVGLIFFVRGVSTLLL